MLFIDTLHRDKRGSFLELINAFPSRVLVVRGCLFERSTGQEKEGDCNIRKYGGSREAWENESQRQEAV